MVRPLFRDRRAAGRRLASVAQVDEAPLDVFVVRKLGVPGHEELAMGAVATGGAAPLDDLVRHELPRLMAALLLLAARIIAILEPTDMTTEERLERLIRPLPTQPTHWELERAARILNLTL